MAGEARIKFGIGYVFDGAELPEDFGHELEYSGHVDRNLIKVVEPFHGASNKLFAVLAKSTVVWGDPQEGDFDLGIQMTSEPTEAEVEALEQLKSHIGVEPTKPLGIVFSVTADM